jgi:pilus assembly protein CpaC
MRRFLTILVLILSLAGVTAPRSSFGEFFSDDFDMPTTLDLVLGETKVLDVNNPQRVAIGDPAIADVAGASAKEIIISAKKVGETNLQIWDKFGKREIFVRVFIEDLQKLKSRLEDLFKTAGVHGVTFQVGDQERKIFVLGDMPLRKKDVVEQLLESFKEKVINLVVYKEDNPLVQIDVQVLEISKTAIDKLGVRWVGTTLFSESQGTDNTQTLPRHFGDMIKGVGQSQFTRTDLTALLNLLEQDNLARTLARPKLVALSGKEAKFLVGGEVPVLGDVSVDNGSTTTSVDYVEYGIKLNIKPEVKENGDILCQMLVEIKTIDTSTELVVQTGESISTSTPGFKTRNVQTELYLKGDQTVFMAGLISNEEANNLTRVPGLGNLPIVGALFRSKEFQLGDTELVISITPKVINYGDMKEDIQAASNAAAGRADEEPEDAYARQIQEIILKNVAYPMEAQRANLSGSVVLSLHLLSSGQLVNVVVNESSGHPLLDKAATFTAQRLAPYPGFPKTMLLKEIWVEVPINYQLN